MTKSTKPNAPSHEVFHVVGDGETARWTKIGIGWSHKDNEGLNLVISYSPLVSGRTVVRRIKVNTEAEG
jgi:hypothetical protein